MNFSRALLLGLLLAAVVCGGCMRRGGPPAGAGAAGGMGAMTGPPPVPVVVAPVELQPYAPAIELTGDIRASQRATLAAEVSGKVVAIAHRVGEKNAQASVLISIDPASYQAGVNAAKADLDAAEQALSRLENGPRPQEIAAQEAAVAAAQAQYNQALDNLTRQSELYKQGVVPQSAMVAAQSAADAAKAGVDAAQQVLDSLRQGSRKEDIGGAQARVDQARSGLAVAQLMLSRTMIKPSFDAVVTALYVEVGQYVGPGSPVCEVIADEPAEAWFNLPQDKAADVKTGAVVELRADALPDAVIKGSVISVSPAADPTTRQFPVRVAVKDERLKPGMAVRGRILTAEPKPTLMISDNAPVQSKLGLVVYRMVPPGPNDQPTMPGMPALPSVESVPVEVGAHVDGLTVLLHGNLKAGDMIVTRGKEQLYISAKIIPTNLMPQGGAGGAGAAGGAPGAASAAGAPGAAGGQGAPEAGGQAPAAGGGAGSAPSAGAGGQGGPPAGGSAGEKPAAPKESGQAGGGK